MTLVFAIAYKRLLVEELHPRRRSRSALADKILDRLQRESYLVADETDSKIPQAVRAAFETLRVEQRDVLSLRIVAGLSIEQTADVIGSNTENVMAAQRKGLAKLRGAMSTPVTLL